MPLAQRLSRRRHLAPPDNGAHGKAKRRRKAKLAKASRRKNR